MKEPLKIVTFKWGDKYTARHVAVLFGMLARNLTIPWSPVLITDQPEADRNALFWDFGWGETRLAAAGLRVLPLWQDMRDAKLCGVRIRAFGADMVEMIGPRFAWIDLDMVITGNVDHIFGRAEPFVALATPRPPMPYNGSLVMMDAGVRAEVQAKWNPLDYHDFGSWMGSRYGVAAGTVSDEGWMWSMMPQPATPTPWEAPYGGQATFGRADGIYYWRHDLGKGSLPLPADARIVVMNGRAFDPASPRCQRAAPWIAEHWRP